jgi:hypothetical protein
MSFFNNIVIIYADHNKYENRVKYWGENRVTEINSVILHGIIINYNNHLYILALSKDILDCNNIYIQYYNNYKKEINTINNIKIVQYSYEYGLVLLNCENGIENYLSSEEDDDIINTFFDLNKYDFKLETVLTNITIPAIYPNNINILETANLINTGIIDDILFISHHHALPQNIYYIITLDQNTDLPLIGFPCYYDNKLLGIVKAKNKENNYIVIPLISIFRFINEVSTTGHYLGLTGIAANFKFEFNKELNKNDSRKFFSYTIDNNYGIKYAAYNKKNDVVIKEGDILQYIDNISITNSGNVYDHKLGYYIPLNTYISLNYLYNEKINFNVIRNRQYININIHARTFWSMLYLPLSIKYDVFQKNTHINLKGLNFIILTDEIISYYINKGVKLSSNVISKNIIQKYKNYLNSQKIVLIEIDKNCKFIYSSENIQLTTIDDNQTYNSEMNLYLLKKINNIKITSIDDIMQFQCISEPIDIILKNDKDIKIII